MQQDILKQLDHTLQSFIDRELTSRWEQLDSRNDQILSEITNAAHSAGLLLTPVPVEAGGSGLGPDAMVFLLEKLATCSPAFSTLLASHFSCLSIILFHPPETEINELLKQSEKMITVPSLLSLGIWEDPQPIDFHGFIESIETWAASSEESLLVTGRKTGLFFSPLVSGMILLARDEEKRPCWVFVKSEGNAISSRALPDTLGLRLCPFSNLSLNESPALSRWPFQWADAAPLIDGFLAAVGVGIARGAIERALKYTVERYQGGGMICDHDAVRNILADRTISIHAARALAYRSVCDDFGPQQGGRYAGAAAFAAELAPRAALDAIQLLGGYGYMKDYQIERFLRDGKTLETMVVRAQTRKNWYIDEVVTKERG